MERDLTREAPISPRARALLVIQLALCAVALRARSLAVKVPNYFFAVCSALHARASASITDSASRAPEIIGPADLLRMRAHRGLI